MYSFITCVFSKSDLFFVTLFSVLPEQQSTGEPKTSILTTVLRSFPFLMSGLKCLPDKMPIVKWMLSSLKTGSAGLKPPVVKDN